jgi:hypothetical protein
LLAGLILVDAWWGRLGSNQGPIGYEPTALTTELRPLVGVDVSASVLL